MKSLKYHLGRLWDAWKRLGKAIGHVQAKIVLALFYAIFVFPFGIMVRLFSDPLRIKKRPSEWLDYPDKACDMQWARRQ